MLYSATTDSSRVARAYMCLCVILLCVSVSLGIDVSELFDSQITQRFIVCHVLVKSRVIGPAPFAN